MSLGIPREMWGDIFNRWRAEGSPILAKFAPYAAHCQNVELFFSIAVGSDLISKDRPSNKADLAYLYYLPFCMVFAAGDKLHAATVPLFLRGDQVFVSTVDMKVDLKRLDDHYSALPDDIKKKGVMSFAFRPPLEGDFLATKLWDRFLSPTWRKPKEAKLARTPEEERELIRKMREMAQGAKATEDVGVDEADFVVIERTAPVQVGKWRIRPSGVEDHEDNRPQ